MTYIDLDIDLACLKHPMTTELGELVDYLPPSYLDLLMIQRIQPLPI